MHVNRVPEAECRAADPAHVSKPEPCNLRGHCVCLSEVDAYFRAVECGCHDFQEEMFGLRRLVQRLGFYLMIFDDVEVFVDLKYRHVLLDVPFQLTTNLA